MGPHSSYSNTPEAEAEDPQKVWDQCGLHRRPYLKEMRERVLVDLTKLPVTKMCRVSCLVLKGHFRIDVEYFLAGQITLLLIEVMILPIVLYI